MKVNFRESTWIEYDFYFLLYQCFRTGASLLTDINRMIHWTAIKLVSNN